LNSCLAKFHLLFVQSSAPNPKPTTISTKPGAPILNPLAELVPLALELGALALALPLCVTEAGAPAVLEPEELAGADGVEAGAVEAVESDASLVESPESVVERSLTESLVELSPPLSSVEVELWPAESVGAAPTEEGASVVTLGS